MNLIFILIMLGLTGYVAFQKLLVVITVDQWSMYPTFEPGERLLAVRYWPIQWLQKEQVILLALPGKDGLFIKRVKALPGDAFSVPIASQSPHAQIEAEQTWHILDGQFFVCGDNPEGSLDSRVWGPLPFSCLRGRAILRLPRYARVPTKDIFTTTTTSSSSSSSSLIVDKQPSSETKHPIPSSHPVTHLSNTPMALVGQQYQPSPPEH